MKFKNIPKWILTHLSVLTMVIMPVAQGHAAEKQQQEISKAMVQNAIYEMGLNKSTTYGEFFKKNKDKYPLRLQKELAPYFAKFSTHPMPQFDVGTAKGSDGKMYPTLRISQNGQLHNVQIFGETDRYAKFNNTTLTEVDLINFDDALIRLAAGDVKLRQQLETAKNDAKSTQKSFTGFPEVTKDSWAKLTPEQRAGYVISMRLLYNDARGVLLASSKSKKPTKKGKKFSFLESLIGEEAFAVPAAEPEWEKIDVGSESANVNSASVSKAPNQGLDSCLVAGYVTSYKGKVCKYSEMIKNYSDVSSLARKAYAACGNGAKIACNPLVFGTPGGNPICIDRKDNVDVQRATHYEGPCERGNHTNSKISFLNDENDKSARYDSKNVNKSSEQIKAEAKAEQEKAMFQSTKDYISGILKFKDPSLQALFIDNKPNEQVINELLQIKKDFDSEVSQATEACKSASSKKGYHEKNFWGACDQLQRRFIFVAEYLSKNPGCKDGKPVDSTTLKCSCADGSNVIPGGECKAAPVTPPDIIPVKPGTVDAGKCDPVCTSNESCQLQERTDDGIEVWQCVGKDGKKPTTPEKKKKGGFGKFLNAALPWVVGAGALVGMYFLFKPKKVKLNPAGDICPDGTKAPCANSCVSPKVYVAGTGCSCSACPPGQTIVNANTCECGTQSNDVKIVCPDGVTIVDSLADCPKSLYTCWDGSQVENAINCPEKPATTGDTNTKTGK